MAATAATKRKRQQRQAGIRIIILVAILVCINLLAGFFHYGLDLTKEKRFTLSPATKHMLRQMDDVAVFTVYLEGKDFPVGLKRLQNVVRERLKTFQYYAGTHIVFRFVNPIEGKTPEEQDAIYQQLYDKGVKPVGINTSTDESYTQKVIIPYALVSYKGKEMPVKLMDNEAGNINARSVNNSESLLEYNLASAIQRLTLPDKPRIGYIVGHGESLGMETYDALTTLAQYYNVDTIDLTRTYYIPAPETLIIINKPTQAFDEREQFKIDQYVMNGGHVLWCIDRLNVAMDSLLLSQQVLAMDYDLNLDDLLFKYGVRINADLIEDLQCTTIPLVNNSSERGEIFFSEWMYFPLFIPTSHHPIVNNMEEVMGRFASSIDTIANPEVRKTILLESSKYSRITPSPVRVNLNMVKFRPKIELFNKPYQPAAVLLEGKFMSVFKNRLAPGFLKILSDSLHRPFKSEADSTGSMIVIADGDMFTNEFTPRTGPFQMGFWRAHNPPVMYANRNFFLNCVEYLTDNSGLLEARSKDLRLRLLDPGVVKDEKTKWQIINVALPIVLVLIFASVYLFFRKRKYEARVN